MDITPYNKEDAIVALKARVFLLLMSDEVPSIDGPYASALFDIVGGEFGFDICAAWDAIAAFEATQS